MRPFLSQAIFRCCRHIKSFSVQASVLAPSEGDGARRQVQRSTVPGLATFRRPALPIGNNGIGRCLAANARHLAQRNMTATKIGGIPYTYRGIF